MSRDLIINPTTWGVMREQGIVLVKSGFLPSSVNSPEKAIAIIMKGYELGMQPMQAFAHINVISGKPTLSAEGMLAQIWKSIPNAFIDFVRVEDEYCEIHAARPKCTPRKFVFQRSDAEKAQLINKDNWKKYPRAMYKARCISEMARTIFPDALMGCSHTAEELNPDLKMNDEGEVIEVHAETAHKAAEQAEVARLEAEQAAAKKRLEAEELKAKKLTMLHERLVEMGIGANYWPAIIERMKGRKSLDEIQIILDEIELEKAEGKVVKDE